MAAENVPLLTIEYVPLGTVDEPQVGLGGLIVWGEAAVAVGRHPAANSSIRMSQSFPRTPQAHKYGAAPRPQGGARSV
jgi:hypothetical protein